MSKYYAKHEYNQWKGSSKINRKKFRRDKKFDISGNAYKKLYPYPRGNKNLRKIFFSEFELIEEFMMTEYFFLKRESFSIYNITMPFIEWRNERYPIKKDIGKLYENKYFKDKKYIPYINRIRRK